MKEDPIESIVASLDTKTAERLATIETELRLQREDIAELRAYLAQVISELKKGQESNRDEVLNQRLYCSARNPVYDQIVLDVRAMDERMKSVEKLMPALRFMTWVGGAFGLSIVALIWGIITHTVTLIIP